jgi:hypothetical protein
MKIAIARLRSYSVYREPLHDVSACDSFYENLRQYIAAHPEHEYLYYNFSFGAEPTRDVTAIARADVVIIPSEAEFTYFIPHRFHPKTVEKSHAHLAKLHPHLHGKPLILLRSDRADTPELYRTHTFANVSLGAIHTIDETEFPAGIHGMRYHFITDMPQWLMAEAPRQYDFAYWGSDKRKGITGQDSGDTRHEMLRRVYRNSDIASLFVGYSRNITPQHKWLRSIDLIPLLFTARATICYNWMSTTEITARYVEAVACGMIPFVWHEYDTTNKIVAYEWQRIRSYEELREKLLQLRDADIYARKMHDVRDALLQILPTREEYFRLFESKLSRILKAL